MWHNNFQMKGFVMNTFPIDITESTSKNIKTFLNKNKFGFSGSLQQKQIGKLSKAKEFHYVKEKRGKKITFVLREFGDGDRKLFTNPKRYTIEINSSVEIRNSSFDRFSMAKQYIR